MTPSALIVCLLAGLALLSPRIANGERTKVKMYEIMNGTAACFRRLNGTHQTGCTSARSGSTGIIHLVRNETDVDFILQVGVASPYVPVLSLNQMTAERLSKFKSNHDRIAGIVTYKDDRPSFYSNELKCPNQGYGYREATCDARNAWNPHGTGVLFQDYPFPIFLIEDKDSLDKINKCFHKFNNFDFDNQHMRSLCALELNSFMSAAVNSESCLRRSKSVINFTQMRYCDPLGDKNVWATLFPYTNRTKVILVTARMDTTSLYDGVTPGAVSPVTGIVTLLTTSRLLKMMVDDKGNTLEDARNVFFVLFNGESYDYIGSSRFVYDIKNGAFPMDSDPDIQNPLPKLKLDDIELVVELGQLGNMSTLYASHIKSAGAAEDFRKILNSHGDGEIRVETSERIPPASLQSFLAESEAIQGLVLTDHGDKSFENKYYNSIYDDVDNIRYTYLNLTDTKNSDPPAGSVQSYIAKVSMVLARGLYEKISGKNYTGDVLRKQNHAALVADELLHCYLNTTNCKINQATTLQQNFDNKPQPLYVGVHRSSNLVTAFTGFALAWLTGTINQTMTEKNCSGDYNNPAHQYMWMSTDLNDINSTACYRSTMNFSAALSPAFEIEDYDWASGKYSTWTESVWPDLTVRMFLKPSMRHEIITLSIGTITLVLSMATVYFIKTKSDILFPKPAASSPGTSC